MMGSRPSQPLEAQRVATASWSKRLSLLVLMAISLAAACSDDPDSGGGSTSGGTGGDSDAGGAAGEAGEGATSGVGTGGRGATGSGGTSGSGGAGEGGDGGGVGCSDAVCEAEDCPCSCDYFFQEGTFPNIKALLKFQTVGIEFDYSSESIKTAFADWASDATAIPNQADFRAELCSAWDWLASANRFDNLDQATTALSPNGGPAETGVEPQSAPRYFMPLEDGWRLYARWVAHNVALELRHELPWSLERLAETNPDAAHALLDSTEMMHRRPQGDIELGYTLIAYDPPYSSYLGLTLIGMPRFTFRFLAQNDLVKATEHETAVALLEWARNNLAHFVGPINRESCQQNWGHPYPPTVEMVVEGTNSTVPALPTTIPRFQHWTMGCHGTSQFIKDVLRALNIPVRVPFNCDHAQLWLPGLDLWMDHGDNPHNRNFSESTCSADFLLTDRATFQAAFGTTMRLVYSGGACDADPVGRRVAPESVAMCPM
jgi:hypothetical protein